MGSTESSSLDSVQCLSSALADIERKLADIEDVHMHHDAKICHDDMVVVAGTRIQCRTGVRVITGPVVGIVAQASVKILLEVSLATEVTLNVFLLSDVSNEGRFLIKKAYAMEAFQPRALSLHGLSPGCRYAVYIGGTSPKDSMSRYVTFNTLPKVEDGGGKPLRIMLTHECRADATAPAEADLRNILESAVAFPDPLIPRDDSSNENSQSDTIGALPVHMTIHLGSFLSVEHILKTQAFHILDILTRDDVAPDAWLAVLADTETQLRVAYRKALNAPEVARVLSRAGNIFIGGQGEVGGASLTMLNTARPTTPGGTLFHDSISGTAATAVSQAVATVRARILSEAEDRSAAQEELRELMMAALLRVARRIYWIYLRQTWQDDDSFDEMMKTDASDEEMHRLVLVKYKALSTKRKLQSRMKKTVQKLLDNFGSENTVAGKISKDFAAVGKDIRDLEEDLQGNLNKWILAGGGSDKGSSLPLTAADVGGAVFIFLDSSWGVLGPDGKLRRMTKSDDSHPSNDFEIQIPEHVWPLLLSKLSSASSVVKDGNVNDSAPAEAAPTRLFLLCPDPMLLHTKQSATGPSNIFSLHGHGFTCSLSGSDRSRLLTLVARWQESSIKHAALLVCAGGPALSSLAPLEGWVAPVVTETEEGTQAADEDIGWNIAQARFRFVIVGRLNRVSSLAYSSSSGTSGRYRLKNACCDLSDIGRVMTIMDDDAGEYRMLLRSEGVDGAPTVGFHAVLTSSAGGFVEKSRSLATSFTKCETRFGAAASVTMSNLDLGGALENDSFQLRHVSNPIANVSCVVGPVIGKVSMTSASVLFEFSRQPSAFTVSDLRSPRGAEVLVEVTCVDMVTGVRHPYTRSVPLLAPVCFLFDTLVPDRGYEIRMADTCVSDGPHEVCLGSFKTSSRASVSSHFSAAIALRQEDGDTFNSGFSSDTSKNWLSRFFVVGENAPSLSADAFGATVSDTSQSLVGSMLASSAEISGNAAYHCVHIEEGLAVARAIEELTTPVYNSIDVIIHVGGAVDLSVSLETAISRLLAAEAISAGRTGGAAMYSGYSAKCGIDPSPNSLFEEDFASIEPARLRAEAEEALRDAYRLHWGSSYMKGLLSKGSHLFVSCPALDLLRATHTSSLQHLSRELSPYCVSNLVHMMDKLNEEYQRCLWADSSVDMHSFHEAPAGGVHYRCGGRVCLFELKPRLVLCQEEDFNRSTGPNERLVSDATLDCLSVALFGPNSHTFDFECPVTSFILVSPIPLVLADPLDREGVSQWYPDGTAVNGRPMAYTQFEVGRMLEMLTRWLSADPWTRSGDSSASFSSKREVFVVCGGSRMNFSSVIRCENIFGEKNTARSTEQLCIKQLYCAPFIGVAPDLDGSGAGDTSERAFVEGSFVVTSATGARRYTVTPIRSSSAAQAGVVTAGEKTQETSVLDDDEDLSTAPAGCFHLGLHDLKADRQAIGLDRLPGDVQAVWNKVRVYTDAYSVRALEKTNAVSVDINDVCDVVSAASLKTYQSIDDNGLIRECHELLRKGQFGGVQRDEDVSTNRAARDGLAATEELSTHESTHLGASQGVLLSKIIAFLLNRMPPAMRRLFPGAPSGVVTRLVWSQFSSQCVSSKGLQKAFSQVGAVIKQDDILFASLCSDYPSFSRLCLNSLIALALFPHCSLALGLNDGS